MARSLASRQVNFMQVRNVPEIVPQVFTFFLPPKGANFLSRLSRIPREYAADIVNLSLVKGRMASRLSVALFGPAAADPVMLTADYVSSLGTVVPFRFTTTEVQYHSGGTWISVTGDTISGGITDFFTYTAWADKLLFDNGQSGIHEWIPGTATCAPISGAPKAEHITSFGSRVIASSVRDPTYHPERIRWSVKNNSNDWTGLGSGFEDLLSAPGGQVDAVMGVYPITDDTALIIRSNSIWQMSLTGFVDAPFRFTLLFDEIGCESRQSIQSTPDGVIFLGKDDVYLVGRGGMQKIGEPILDELIGTLRAPRDAYGAYVGQTKRRYFLGVKDQFGGDGLNVLWEYSIEDAGWTRRTYPFDIRAINPKRSASSASGGTIDELSGTIDGLSGSIDELGGGAASETVYGIYLTMAGTGRYSTTEDLLRTQDVNNAGTDVSSGFELRTGVLHTEDPLFAIDVLELQLEYESDAAQTLEAEYSLNGGATWLAYSTATIGVTNQPSLVRFRKAISAKQVMFRLRSSTLGKLTVIALRVNATKGPMVLA